MNRWAAAAETSVLVRGYHPQKHKYTIDFVGLACEECRCARASSLSLSSARRGREENLAASLRLLHEQDARVLKHDCLPSWVYRMYIHLYTTMHFPADWLSLSLSLSKRVSGVGLCGIDRLLWLETQLLLWVFLLWSAICRGANCLVNTIWAVGTTLGVLCVNNSRENNVVSAFFLNQFGALQRSLCFGLVDFFLFHFWHTSSMWKWVLMVVLTVFILSWILWEKCAIWWCY